MKKKVWMQNLPLIILAIAISFSPSFYGSKIAGGRVIEIRIEDILMVILGLVWITNFLISGREKIEKPPLFFPILLWLGIGFFSVLTNWILGNIALSRGFFYFLKEVEFFFFYFYVFYHIRSFGVAKFITDFWVVLAAGNMALIFFQLVRGRGYGAYGPGLFMEFNSLAAGTFFLLLFAYFLNLFLYYYSQLDISKIKKTILFLFVLSLPVGVVSSGCRTTILGLPLVVASTFFFYQLKRGGLKPLFSGLLIFSVVLLIFIFVSSKVPYGRAIESPISALAPRISIWKEQIRLFPDNLFSILLGRGKSVLLLIEESHSQYVRNFVETGIIGSLIFFILIFAIIKKSFRGFSSGREPILIGLSIGLLVSTLFMLFNSITSEAFLVVKPNELYWFFAAITMAVLSFNKK